jgi:hypothetical protein
MFDSRVQVHTGLVGSTRGGLAISLAVVRRRVELHVNTVQITECGLRCGRDLRAAPAAPRGCAMRASMPTSSSRLRPTICSPRSTKITNRPSSPRTTSA